MRKRENKVKLLGSTTGCVLFLLVAISTCTTKFIQFLAFEGLQ